MPSDKQDKQFAPYLHTIDIAVCRYNREKEAIEVLLHRRDKAPFKDQWALPGIVVNGDTQDKTIEDALNRLLNSPKVNKSPWYVEQVCTVGSADRDPRGWSSSTVYFAITSDENEVDEHRQYHDLKECASGKLNMPFDHNTLCKNVLERMVSKSLYSNLPMLFLGERVTFMDALKVTSVVLDREVPKGSMGGRFTRMVEEGYLTETDEKISRGAGPKLSVRINPNPGEMYLFDKSFKKTT